MPLDASLTAVDHYRCCHLEFVRVVAQRFGLHLETEAELLFLRNEIFRQLHLEYQNHSIISLLVDELLVWLVFRHGGLYLSRS